MLFRKDFELHICFDLIFVLWIKDFEIQCLNIWLMIWDANIACLNALLCNIETYNYFDIVDT